MHIIVGYVHTPEGEAALDQALEEARSRGAHLIVVHSTLRDVPPEPPEGDFYEQELPWIDEMLTREGIPHTVREMLGDTSAADDILQAAEDSDAGLIVIGLPSWTRHGKHVLGTNVTRILVESPCPVLAVKTAAGTGDDTEGDGGAGKSGRPPR